MGLHFWVIPVMGIVAVGSVLLYLLISRSGGSGVREEGRTLVDKPVDEKTPKAGWNYYGKP